MMIDDGNRICRDVKDLGKILTKDLEVKREKFRM